MIPRFTKAVIDKEIRLEIVEGTLVVEILHNKSNIQTISMPGALTWLWDELTNNPKKIDPKANEVGATRRQKEMEIIKQLDRSKL